MLCVSWCSLHCLGCLAAFGVRCLASLGEFKKGFFGVCVLEGVLIYIFFIFFFGGGCAFGVVVFSMVVNAVADG